MADNERVGVGPVSISAPLLKYLIGGLPGGLLMLVVVSVMLWNVYDNVQHRNDCEAENRRLHEEIGELRDTVKKNQETGLKALDKLEGIMRKVDKP